MNNSQKASIDGKTCVNAGSDVSPTNYSQSKHDPKLANPFQLAGTRHAMLRCTGALGLSSIEPSLAMANSPPRDANVEQALVTSTSRRRSLGFLAGCSVLGINMPTFATMPTPAPASIAEQLKYSGNYLYVGKLRRIVYMSRETGRSFLVPGADVNFRELEFFDRPSGGPAVLEIDHAIPLMIRSSDLRHNLPRGKIYSFVQMGVGVEKQFLKDIDTEMLYVFQDRKTTIGERTLTSDSQVFESGGRTPLDRFPAPIGELADTIAIAQKLGYIKP